MSKISAGKAVCLSLKGEFSENTQRFLPFHSLDDCPEILVTFLGKVTEKIIER